MGVLNITQRFSEFYYFFVFLCYNNFTTHILILIYLRKTLIYLLFLFELVTVINIKKKIPF